jgi:crotonobetainyl-CoA:carnitine CoA-transferase CaiB-like acyl-CoA transferase
MMAMMSSPSPSSYFLSIFLVSADSSGTIKLPGFPIKYSETPLTLRQPPPLLGQHTKEVLQSVLGYDETKIEQLVQAKIVTIAKV